MKFKKSREDFDQSFFESVEAALVQAGALQLTDDEISGLVSQATDTAFAQTAASVAARLKKTMPSMLRRHRRIHRKFERRLRKAYGAGLDLLYAVIVCAEEMGGDLVRDQQRDPDDWRDPLTEAIFGLHARSCRTAIEVYHLLSQGLPMGALARCRTLHEISVTSAVLVDNGREPEYADLAERYLLHDGVISYKDLLTYQERAEVLGYEPFSDEEVTEIKAEFDQLVSRFGASYKGDNGWAAPLFGGRNPMFWELEKSADLSHMRGHYKWASHEVHADAKGWRLNHFVRDGLVYRSTGYANIGLSDPADLARASLVQTTVSLMMANGPTPKALVGIKAIQALGQEVADAFAAGEEYVWEREEKLIRKAAERSSDRPIDQG